MPCTESGWDSSHVERNAITARRGRSFVVQGGARLLVTRTAGGTGGAMVGDSVAGAAGWAATISACCSGVGSGAGPAGGNLLAVGPGDSAVCSVAGCATGGEGSGTQVVGTQVAVLIAGASVPFAGAPRSQLRAPGNGCSCRVGRRTSCDAPAVWSAMT